MQVFMAFFHLSKNFQVTSDEYSGDDQKLMGTISVKMSNCFEYLHRCILAAREQLSKLDPSKKHEFTLWHTDTIETIISDSQISVLNETGSLCEFFGTMKVATTFNTYLSNGFNVSNNPFCFIAKEYNNRPQFKANLLPCFENLATACNHLSLAFSAFGKGTSIGFKNGTDEEWKQLRKKIEENFTKASELLKSSAVIKFFKISQFDLKGLLQSLDCALKKYSDAKIESEFNDLVDIF